MAVKVADATELVVKTVMMFEPLLKVPDGPDAGAVKVTNTILFAGLFPESCVVTESGTAYCELMVALCGVVPAFVVIATAGPGVLVNEKFTVVSPVTAAVML